MSHNDVATFFASFYVYNNDYMTLFKELFKSKAPNLFPYIKKDAQKITSLLESYTPKFKLVESFPHRWEKIQNKKEKFSLTIYWGKPIWYNEGVYIWHKVVVRSQNSEQELQSILNHIKLTPFKDEQHSPSGIHYNSKTNTSSCYINLDFPKGYKIKNSKFRLFKNED